MRWIGCSVAVLGLILEIALSSAAATCDDLEAVGDRYLAAALTLPEPYARATAAKLLAISLSEPALKALNAFPWTSLANRDRELIEHFIRRRQSPITGSATKSRQEVLIALARIPNYSPDFGGFASEKDLTTSAVRHLEAGDLEALRDARRRSITGISDEALGEYFAIPKRPELTGAGVAGVSRITRRLTSPILSGPA